MIRFLNLIRWKNLLLLALTQILVKFALFESLKNDYGLETTLTNLQFSLLVLATLCIAAAGYIINDIEDIEADIINKPDKVIVGKYISEKTATHLFILFNSLGVLFGFLMAYSIDKPRYFIIFVFTSILLYIYSTQLKHIILIGNITIAFLVSLSVLLVGVFDLIPAMNNSNNEIQIFFLKLTLDYTIFAFMINLLRELVKDIEDINGDYKINVNSLPILLGQVRATKIVFTLSLIPVFTLIFYLINNLYKQTYAIAYVLILIIAPLIFISIKLLSAEVKKDYKQISTLLKIVMLSGVLSLLLFQFILSK